MHPVIAKTFGGLSREYYFRQLVFGLAFLAFFVLMMLNSPGGVAIGALVVMVINALLYPYSRFVYESIMGFIMGNNVFFVNALLMLLVKLVTMLICFMFAIFIAPVGLAYLYYHHSKQGA